jgi:hypothetical protein
VDVVGIVDVVGVAGVSAVGNCSNQMWFLTETRLGIFQIKGSF